MQHYKCKLATNQTYSFFSFGFWTHTHTSVCSLFCTYSLRMFVIFVVLYDADMTCLMWCKFFRKVTGTHPQSPKTLHLSLSWFHDLPTPTFSPTSSWMRKGWRWEKRWQGRQRTAKTHGWSWLCPLVQADAIGRIQHRQSDVWEDKMSVFFGFLLVVCHALQWWQGRGVSLFPAVLGVCTIHFLLKCCRCSLFWWISRPLGLPYFTDVCFLSQRSPFSTFWKGTWPFDAVRMGLWDLGSSRSQV